MNTKNEIAKAMAVAAYGKFVTGLEVKEMEAAFDVANAAITNAVLEEAAQKLQSIVDSGLPENSLHAKPIHDVTEIFINALRSMKVKNPCDQ